MRDLTVKQLEIRRQLGEQFNIDPERILFLNASKPEEAWLNAEALTTIARNSGNFQEIDESFNQFVSALNQIIHSATVVDANGRRYTRAGVATIGESDEIDDHGLAAGRAISAALRAAGFDPLRPGAAVVLDLKLPQGASPIGATPVVEAHERTIDLRRIHVLASEKGLIKHLQSGEKDVNAYRQMLKDRFGVSTVVAMTSRERASVINYMKQLPDVDEFAAEEFADEEQMAVAK